MVTETTLVENDADGLNVDELRTNWNWKKEFRFGTWNLRTLNRNGATEDLERNMNNYKISLAALQEMRLMEVGVEELEKGYIYHSGKNDGRKEEGVGFYVKKDLKDSIIEFEAISSRIATSRFLGRPRRLERQGRA